MQTIYMVTIPRITRDHEDKARSKECICIAIVYIAESAGYLTGSELAEIELKSWKWSNIYFHIQMLNIFAL